MHLSRNDNRYPPLSDAIRVNRPLRDPGWPAGQCARQARLLRHLAHVAHPAPRPGQAAGSDTRGVAATFADTPTDVGDLPHHRRGEAADPRKRCLGVRHRAPRHPAPGQLFCINCWRESGLRGGFVGPEAPTRAHRNPALAACRLPPASRNRRNPAPSRRWLPR